MAAPAIALLVAGAIGLHLERTVDLGLEDALAAVHELAGAIGRRTSSAPSVDDPVWRGCEADDRCVPQIRARLGVERVILVRAYGGPRGKVRISCELAAADGSIVAKTELDLPKDRSTWPAMLDAVAANLLPVTAPRDTGFHSIAFRDAPLAPPEAQLAGGEPKIWPWVLIGAGTIFAVTGAAFGSSAASAKTSLEARIHGDREYDELSGRQESHAVTANVLFITAVLAAATGAGWLVLD